MKTIAVSGKGGTGKSTITALIIHWLSRNISKSILAVDADSNVNLNELLGVKLRETIGTIREEMKSMVNVLPGGMTKQQFLEYKIHSSLVETPNFDLIAMGRPEGPGCYCYANNLLRDILKTLGENYEFVIVDNEAGMEHLSRRTTQNIDYLLVVSDPSPRGIQASGRISRLLKELEARIGKRYLIINRLHDPIPEAVEVTIEQEGLKLLCSIPEDEKILKSDQEGKPIWDIIPKSSAYQTIDRTMKELAL